MHELPFRVPAYRDPDYHALKLWPYGDQGVYYRPKLAGHGTLEAEWYFRFIKRRYGDRTFSRAFEWCSGPGFIGFVLLFENVCESVCFADINPDAIDCVKRTVEHYGLQDRVTYYVSDNLREIPDHERFDLVVGNPPYACNINPAYGSRRDPIPSDVMWKTHKDFYSSIARHLSHDAQVCISELAPFDERPFPHLSDGPWDIRPRAPIVDFCAQINDGGLTLREVVFAHYNNELRITEQGKLDRALTRDWFWVLISEKSEPLPDIPPKLKFRFPDAVSE